MTKNPLRIGIGGPVGSGKTALVDALCKTMRERYRLGVVTNDIFTREDMEFLVRSQALPDDRIIGVQTGGCPHTAIREDASMNFDALDERERRAIPAQPTLEPFVERVTLTVPVLGSAPEVVFIVTGEEKADAVERAFGRPPGPETPSSLIRSAKGRTRVVADAAAASRLSA